MFTYTVRRLALVLVTLLGVSLLLFLLMHIAPGGPETILIGEDMPPEMAERIRIGLGLHRPIHVRYLIWLSNIARGDFGRSFKTGHPVLPLVMETLPRTVVLGLAALIFSVAISIVVGVISAVRQYSAFDHGVTLVSFMGISMPNFWLGLMFMMFFGFRLGWFPISGTGTIGMQSGTLQFYLDRLHHLVLPAVVLGTARMAALVRYSRSSMLEVMRMDYIRTARAKGLHERVVIYKHALRNALMPIVTIIGLSLRFLVSGSVLVESVFAYSGVGRLAVHSVFQRDYPVIMGVNMMISVVVLMANLLTDLAYAVVDPRIRYD